MVAIEQEQWPLVIVRWQAPVCGCDLDLYREAFESWLQRGERFALISTATEPLRLPPCLLDQMAAWMRRRRFIVAARCAALASVFPLPMTDGWKCDYRAAASAQLGCPAAAFAHEHEALQWAMDRLRPLTPARTTALAAPPACDTIH